MQHQLGHIKSQWNTQYIKNVRQLINQHNLSTNQKSSQNLLYTLPAVM